MSPMITTVGHRPSGSLCEHRRHRCAKKLRFLKGLSPAESRYTPVTSRCHPIVADIAARHAGQRITFGEAEGNDYRLLSVNLTQRRRHRSRAPILRRRATLMLYKVANPRAPFRA
jgi:hypothetical protein